MNSSEFIDKRGDIIESYLFSMHQLFIAAGLSRGIDDDNAKALELLEKTVGVPMSGRVRKC